MGRKRNAAKSKERASVNSKGREEFQPQIANPSFERVELWDEKTNQSLEKVESQPKMQSNSSNGSLKKKGKHVVGISVRRSVRLQGTAVHTHNQDNQDIERLIDEVTLTESEKEDEPSTDEMEQPKPTMENKNLEDKVDYLIQLVESQQSKFSPHENLCMCYARYKNLYFDSQKKIETLTNENHQLALKLENALGKLESTENHTRSYSELLEKWKDVIFASNLTKAVESISSQAGHAQDAGREAKTPLAKRKKFDK